MKKRFKGILKAGIVVAVSTSLCFPIMADTLDDERANKQNLENKLTDVQDVIDELSVYKNDVQSYVTQLDSKMNEIMGNISYYDEQINSKQAQIDDMNNQIEELNKKYDEQYEAMKLRITYMYENGNDQFFNTFFSSESFGEMLNKYEYLEKLVTYDQNQMESMNNTVKEMQDAQVQIEAEMDAIKEYKKSQEVERAAVDELLTAKNRELSEYSGKIASLEEQEQKLEREIQQSQGRINAIVGGYSGPVYSGGSLMMPLPYYSYVSTWYGWREWDQQYHKGIDFAVGSGTPIYAAADGVVVVARGDYGPNRFYDTGNYVVIYHGNGLYTEYMHCSAINVSLGQNVSAGQTIAWVGSTGYSTGAHLHFGVAECSGGFSTSGRVDPAPYLGL